MIAADTNRAPFCWPPMPLPPQFATPPTHGPTRFAVNCNDFDGDALTVTVTQPPAHGTLVVNPGGTTFTYTPDPTYTGSDSWHYAVDDGHGGTAPNITTVDVAPGHDPVCTDLAVSVPVNGSVTLANPCTDADTDEIVVEAARQPAHGTLTFSDKPHREFTYTPAAGFTGVDTATIVAHDEFGGNAPAPRTLTFTVGTPPVDKQQDRPAPTPPPITPPPAPTPEEQAAGLLRGAATRFGLGFGDDATGFLARGGVRPGQTAGVVFCRRACSVRIAGVLKLKARGAKAAKGLTLTPRTLRVAAAQRGTFAIALTRAQKARLKAARGGTVALTLQTTVGKKRQTVRRAVVLKP